jgi:Xaa-Pro aminopeptidase
MTQRIDALRTALDKQGRDAFYSLNAPANQYLTGFTGTTSGVLVTGKEALFLTDSRYTEQAADQLDPAFTLEPIPNRLAKRLGGRMKDLAVKTPCFEPGAVTVSERQAVEEGFSGETAPEAGLCSKLRQRKEAGEVEKIRRALRLSEAALQTALEDLELGMMERELAARLEYEFKRLGASGFSFPTIALYGARSSLPHGEPGERALESGDIALIDFGCRLQGYCSDLTRTYVYDRMPAPWFEEVYELVRTAQQIAIESAKAGMTCRELDAVARRLIDEAGHGEHFGHGLGHGLGIEIHEGPSLNPQSDTVLEPGMVVTVEPGIYLPGQGGVRIEDVVAIKEDGCEVLSSAPKEFRIL